jgi:hypothetical protein
MRPAEKGPQEKAIGNEQGDAKGNCWRVEGAEKRHAGYADQDQ